MSNKIPGKNNMTMQFKLHGKKDIILTFLWYPNFHANIVTAVRNIDYKNKF